MEPFTSHSGILATLDRANVDTDQIIPKQFLKSIRRTGFGCGLFFDWRYLADASPNPAFSLNASSFQGASLLVTRNNFGCGSSREHAVWAVTQYGFRVVIAPWEDRAGERIPGFADIFRSNAGKNGLLLIELSAGEVQRIFDLIAHHPGARADVDLPAQELRIQAGTLQVFHFEMEAALKEKFLRGLDDIALTLQHADAIAAFERTHDTQRISPAR